VLSAVLMALTLEGVLPGLVRRVRRPIPFVRYDRVREPRARGNLHALARRLVEADEPPVAAAFRESRRTETWSGAGSTGARTVFFSSRA
jgi:hypothetical protein